MDDIATAASTTRVTFYAHFPNKAELMRALFDDLNALLERGESPEHRSTARPLVEAVRIGTGDAIRPWILAQAARWPDIQPYITVLSEASAVDAEIRELNDHWFGEVIDDITEGLNQADRFAPASRRFRGHLAMDLLHGANLRWIAAPWPIEGAPEFDILASAWVSLIGVDARGGAA